MTVHIHTADAVQWAKEYKDEPYHALLCDPPYNLSTISKRFGKSDSAPAKYGTDGAFQRASRGFMGQEWDSDIAFQPSTWEAFKAILYDGAFGLAFAGARTYHHMASAIEAAGLIIHPMIGWVYASGMPKATRLRTDHEAWKGYRYGLGALKPALEPICVFQKPYAGRPANNILTTGAGALNIEGTRIPSSEPYTINTWNDDAHPFGGGAGNSYTGRQETGRWPANLILDDVGAKTLDAQSGKLKSGKMTPNHKRGKTAGTYQSPHGVYGRFNGDNAPLKETIGDEGGASRFFFRSTEQLLDASDPVFYHKKSAASERDAGLEGRNPHPTIKPIGLNKYLATLLLPPEMYAPRRIFNPFAGTGSEAIGAALAGWEEVHAIEIDPAYAETARLRVDYWCS